MIIFAAPVEMPLLVRSSRTSGRPVIEVSCVMGAAVGDVLVPKLTNQDSASGKNCAILVLFDVTPIVYIRIG